MSNLAEIYSSQYISNADNYDVSSSHIKNDMD